MKPTYSTLLRRITAVALLYASVLSPAPALAYDSIEELLDRSEPEGNAEELFSDLDALRRNKIPINLATEEQLLELPLLTAVDAAKIIDWRRQRGPIVSITELEAAIGADAARRVAPYLSFELPPEKEKKKDSRNALKGSVIGRAFWENPPRAGIANGKYTGGNRNLYSRFQAATPHYGVHLLSESDIGERQIDDFLSFNVHAERIGILTQVVAGNYRLSFGQGLLFGQGRYFSKGTDAIDGVLLFSPALRPYNSAGEDNFLQGAAATISPGPFEVIGFTSNNKLDATINGGGVVTSISTSGYHRTATEREKKDNLTQEVDGVNLRYRYRAGELSAGIGATWAKYSYDLPLASLGGERGDQLGSVEASAVYRDVQVFGEAAFSRRSNALSWLCGVQANLAAGVTGVASMREYAIDYYSPFANPFAERGDGASNEEGFYLGLKARALENLTLAASYDIFRFPKLDKTYYPLPSSGHDARFYVTWKQNRWLTWDGMYQHKENEDTRKQLDADNFLQYYTSVPKTSNRVQLTLKTRVDEHVDFKTGGAYKRLENRLFNGSQTEKGWLVYQQLNMKSGPFTVKTRVSRFDTDSYETALYAYEDDLPLVYTLNTYYGHGKAWFIMLDFEPVKDFSLTAKYETTWYDDRAVYGSGNDLRKTSSPSSFNLGCMLKF